MKGCTMKDKTHIVYIVDRSGSMGGRELDVIGGFNTFIKEQKDHQGEASMVLVQFDHEYGPIANWDNIKDAVELNKDSYIPRGSTALLDAVGRTISTQGENLSIIPEGDRPDKVIVLIMTDGLENNSREYSKSRIKEMISHQQENYNWKFVFLGANQDSFAEANSMGIPQNMAANYKPTQKGIKSLYASASDMVSCFRSSGEASFDNTKRPV